MKNAVMIYLVGVALFAVGVGGWQNDPALVALWSGVGLILLSSVLVGRDG